MPPFLFIPPYGAMSREVSGSSVNLDTGHIDINNVWSFAGQNILTGTVGDGWLALPGETTMNGLATLRLDNISVAANAFFGYAQAEVFLVVHWFTLDLTTLTEVRFAEIVRLPIRNIEAPFIGFNNPPATSLNIAIPFSATFAPLPRTFLFGIEVGATTRCSAAVGAGAGARVTGIVSDIRGTTS